MTSLRTFNTEFMARLVVDVFSALKSR